MDDPTYKKWDIRVKLITVIISISAAFIGIYQFNKGQKNVVILEQNLIAKRDSVNTVNRLWEHKIKVYTEIGSSIGAILAYEKRDSTLDRYIKNFEILYYGEGIMVEDSTIAARMNKFKDEIKTYKDTGYISLNQLKLLGMGLVNKIKENIEYKRILHK
jgi:uncharacterized protein YxeA